jgi:squalene synthase HpnC
MNRVVTSNPAAASGLPPQRAESAQPTEPTEPEAARTAFAPALAPEQADVFTRELARTHYENFSVVSLLLPKHLRQDFCNVYAFCRIADDLADEVGDRDAALGYLARFREQTHACYAGRLESAVFVALAGTINRHSIPVKPFLDLIDAFEQDQRVTRYQTFEQLCDYCKRSADPVGRLVLYVCGYADEQRQLLSDRTCTALQLANFWQDVRRDIVERDRIYIPAESMQKFGVTEHQIQVGMANDAYRALIRFEVDRTEAMFDEGEQLLPLLDSSVRSHVSLFGKGGRAILAAIRQQDYDTLSRRPALSKRQKGRLIAAAIMAQAGQLLSRGARA